MLPPPLPQSKGFWHRLPVWGWIGIGACLLFFAALFAAFGAGAWFVTQVERHPERQPVIAGWIDSDEEHVSTDEQRRIIKVRRKSGEIIEVHYEKDPRPPEWLLVPPAWKLRKSWIVRKPEIIRSRWDFTHTESPDQAADEYLGRLRQAGYEIFNERSVLTVRAWIAQRRDPIRTIDTTVNLNTAGMTVREPVIQ